jgi:DNA-binding XRE family transcriptional regulator
MLMGDLIVLPGGEPHNSVEAKRARQFVYLEWLAVPKGSRDPRTKTEMAERLGCSIQTLLAYEREPAFTNELSRRLGASFRVDRLADIFEALVTTALDPAAKSQVPAARTLLEWFDKGQQVKPEDFSQFTDEQLKAALANAK